MIAQDEGPEMAVVSTTVSTDASANVDWPAIIAGAVIATAASFVLFAFGTGVGLSITSPYPAENVSAPTFAIVLGLWILLVTVMSFLLGGYFTGLLMRRRVTGDHEREMRDGMHGALAWALGVLLGALIAAFTVAGVAKTGTQAIAGASTLATESDHAPALYFADVLLRSDNPASVAPVETEARRGEVTRIFLRNPAGEIAPDDRLYLGHVVMRQTGLPDAEATKRVETVIADFRSAVMKMQEAAEKGRKFALFLAFGVAATLAIGAATAWWAAVQGGEHRDQEVDLRSYIGWERGRFRRIS